MTFSRPCPNRIEGLEGSWRRLQDTQLLHALASAVVFNVGGARSNFNTRLVTLRFTSYIYYIIILTFIIVVLVIGNNNNDHIISESWTIKYMSVLHDMEAFLRASGQIQLYDANYTDTFGDI